MGHNANVKLLRRQVRNVAQETFPKVLETEAVQALEKRVMEVVTARLEEIGKNVDKQLATITKDTQTFRGFLMRDASDQISRELTNIAVTNVAWQEMLVGKLEIDNVDEFAAELEAKKQEVRARLQAEAEDEAKAREAEEAAKAASSGHGSAGPGAAGLGVAGSSSDATGATEAPAEDDAAADLEAVGHDNV